MVDPVNRIVWAILRVAARALAVVAGSCAGLAAAADLPDPTRPPISQRRATPTEQTAAPSAPVLQSVLTGAGRKPAVIISGQALELGETFDGMRLVRVTDSGAVLVGPHGTTTLALIPGGDRLAPESSKDAPVVAATAQPRATSAASITFRMADTK